MKKLTLITQLCAALFLMCCGFLACKNTNETHPLIINIQPLDGIKDIKEDVSKFNDYLKRIGLTNYQIRILPHVYSPYEGCGFCDIEEYGQMQRLRADTMIKVLDAPKGEFTIGITDQDISCTVHGIQDFGVLGLSYLGHKYRSCMTSTYRLKDKRDLWKLMVHEFTHAYFSQKHCKADDPHCIMQDAKKRPNFSIKDSLCSVCKEDIKSKLSKIY